MKYALIDGEKIEPTPGGVALCQCCGSDVVAKCGKQRVWHWAHKSKTNCDRWWEPETEWHRNWKDNFPKEWQEVVHFAPNGEKHVADVKTPSGLVIEFQHSPISPEEQKAREDFYGDMLWIVDGTRLKRDKTRFEDDFRWHGFYYQWHKATPHIAVFPKQWVNCGSTVYFDFGYHDRLVCLPPLPGRTTYYQVPREIFGANFDALTESYGHQFFFCRPQNFVVDYLERERDAFEVDVDIPRLNDLIKRRVRLGTADQLNYFRITELRKAVEVAKAGLKNSR
jgi:hypothetical protein